MTETVQKSLLRWPLYIGTLFIAEFIRGNAAQKRRFIGRFTRRLGERLGFFTIAHKLFDLKNKLTVPFQSAEEKTLRQKYPNYLWAISTLENHDYLKSWLRNRYENGPKIIVLGMGSVGDILQITPVLRALREKLPTAQIALLHRSPGAKSILRGNPNVNSITLADFHHFEAIKNAVATEGAADLVVEIQSISYILTYTPAPLALRHPALAAAMPDSFFQKSTAELARWQKHPPIFPRKDDKFSWPDEWKNYQYLDVLGATGNLPINRHSSLDFTTGPEDEAILKQLPKTYVTVQHGVDTDVTHWSRVTGQRATKLLPTETWRETVSLLKAKNYAVIQLGTEDDEAIEGITLDLRGKTNLREAAVILKNAICHIGTEGGLVHLAVAMGTKSVVTFGPTSSTFLGYPNNTNLVASECNSCWWTTKDWFIYCPRGLKTPECMDAHTAESIVAAVLSLETANKAERA